jgi:chemotaxis protein CheC
MDDKNQLLSAEQLDFLKEMMNIGAGNAATALTQTLQCEVNIVVPRVFVTTDVQELSILHDPSLPVVCARMGMVGDADGGLFFIVPEEQKDKLIRLAEQAITGASQLRRAGQTGQESEEMKLSVIAEIGLNIYHTVPTLAIDMIQALLDESLVRLSHQVQHIIVVENEFLVAQELIKTFLVMIPSMESVKILANSIGQARLTMVKDGG